MEMTDHRQNSRYVYYVNYYFKNLYFPEILNCKSGNLDFKNPQILQIIYNIFQTAADKSWGETELVREPEFPYCTPQPNKHKQQQECQ